MTEGTRPRARAGLLASDHSKRGRRFVTVVDPDTLAATLLEPWEHAVLVLCDGSRSASELADLLAPDVDGQAIDATVVRRCLKFFEREGLIDAAGLRHSDAPPPGPVTLTELQRAYAEWHKSADGAPDTGLPPPIPRTSPKIAAGLEPTVTFGQRDKSLLTGVRSLLEAAPEASRADEPEDDEVDEVDGIPDLLAAVDDAVAEASRVDQSQRAKRRAARRPADVQEGESRPLSSGLHSPPRAGVVIAPDLDDAPSTRTPASPPPTSVAPTPEPAVAAAIAPTPSDPAQPTAPSQPATPPVRRAPPTEPTMRLVDLLGTDATEPATILVQPASPFATVRLRDEDTPPADPPRPPRGPPRPADQSPTQLGSLVKKR